MATRFTKEQEKLRKRQLTLSTLRDAEARYHERLRRPRCNADGEKEVTSLSVTDQLRELFRLES